MTDIIPFLQRNTRLRTVSLQQFCFPQKLTFLSRETENPSPGISWNKGISHEVDSLAKYLPFARQLMTRKRTITAWFHTMILVQQWAVVAPS